MHHRVEVVNAEKRHWRAQQTAELVGLPGHEADRVDDRGQIEPELEQDAEQVFSVPEVDREYREEEPHTGRKNREERHRHDEEGKPRQKETPRDG